MAQYDCFDGNNDRRGERDFGSAVLGGAEILWKIDYYNNDFTCASSDPASDAVTARVLTVMLAAEY